jgi:hypothetical protein
LVSLMDTLRGFEPNDTDTELDLSGFEDEVTSEPPPPPLGQDERRMQVRAYNYWAGLLGDRNFPPVTTLLEGVYPDFADNAVLLHFDSGIEDPAIMFAGSNVTAECGTETAIERLSQVPGRSLLSRITDHYMQIIANKAPIGFEAEFVNQHGRSILYRGILLPFSSDDVQIDYIMGVINWKELADQATTDELLLAIGQVLDSPPKTQPRRALIEATDAWADGPAVLELDAFPAPSHGLDIDTQEQPGTLADWLASARELAHVAHSSEDRTRSALYAAIGRAWDFALAAQNAPDDFAELLEDAGLTMQERAPMTPVVKLVFGSDYDKTRLTEYAAALTHAQRIGLNDGELGRYLSEASGGLKGVVNTERRMRREEAGKALAKRGPEALAESLRALPQRKISEIAPADGAEFALVVVRRLENGEIAMIGEVMDDTALFERAARNLIAA